MNVKNKIVALVMSFFICFSSVSNCLAYDKRNINFSMTSSMLGTIATVAVASGVVFNSSDEIYNFGRSFYEKYKTNQDVIKNLFSVGLSIGANKVVTVSKDILDCIKEFIDGYVSSQNASTKYELKGYLGVMPFYLGTAGNYASSLPVKLELSPGKNYDLGAGLSVDIPAGEVGSYVKAVFRLNGASIYTNNSYISSNGKIKYFAYSKDGNSLSINNETRGVAYELVNVLALITSMALIGGYDWTRVSDNVNEDGELDIYAPSKLKDLVGVKDGVIHKDGVLNPPYELPLNGVISLPNVLNPSIEAVEDTIVSTDSPTDAPGGGIVFPPFGGGLDFTPITQGSFTEKFPFSLASDIKNIVSVFNVEPKAPKFTVPIVTEELEIDLTQFSLWASIIRFFVLIGFIISLINITRKVIG